MKMLGLMFLMVSLVDIWCVRSGCFLPDEMPPFTVGLDTSATNETAEVEEFEDWESTMEEHLFSYMLSSTNLDEFIECYSDSVTVNFSDGAGSAMGVDEYRVVSNTYDELVSNFTVKDGSAEFIDENTIEVKFLQKSSGQFGFMRGLVPWIGEKMDSDGSVEWETWTTLLFRIDDDGLIEQFTIASPQFIREILGAIESLYSGPSENDLGSAENKQTMPSLYELNLYLVPIITLLLLFLSCVQCVSLVRLCTRGTVKGYGVVKKVDYDTETGTDEALARDN